MKTAALHEADFTIPQKNVWTEHEQTPHLDFPGSTEPRWVDNLLYFYTQPFDIVIDPFAGSGSTIEVCKKRLRRYWVSNSRPIPERAHEIRLWDVTEGLPPLHNWRDVRLVYLIRHTGSKSRASIHRTPRTWPICPTWTLRSNWRASSMALGRSSRPFHIALIIQPTHWYAPEHAYTDHAWDMATRVQLPLARRIACPRDTPRYTDYLKWAMENREMLALNREIVISGPFPRTEEEER